MFAYATFHVVYYGWWFGQKFRFCKSKWYLVRLPYLKNISWSYKYYWRYGQDTTESYAVILDFEKAQLELVQYKTFNILIHVKLSVCT